MFFEFSALVLAKFVNTRVMEHVVKATTKYASVRHSSQDSEILLNSGGREAEIL